MVLSAQAQSYDSYIHGVEFVGVSSQIFMVAIFMLAIFMVCSFEVTCVSFQFLSVMGITFVT